MVDPLDGLLCHACGEGAERSATRCPACNEALLLSDRYLLERVLGSNVGTTYLATDTHGDRQVVIKELSYGKLDAWKSEDLFQREIRVLRQLDHPQVPAYIDDFSCGLGKRLAHYLVQEHLAGESLREEFEQRHYDEEQVLGIVDQVLEVLEYLQGLRPPLIHRDLKPSNLIRLEGTDKIALIDFGAVRDLIAPTGENPTVAGTFGFMAPEQFQGEAFLQTDLYALGVVALNLLTRIQPQKMLSTGTQLAWQEHVRVSAPMRRLLESLLAPKVGDRPRNARTARLLLAEVRRALRQPAARNEQQASKRSRGFVPIPTPTATPSSAWSRVLLGVVVCALLVGGLAALLLGSSSDRPATPRGPAVSMAPPRAFPQRPTPSRTRRVPSLPASPTKMATDLTAAELAFVLRRHRWRGTIGGELQFTGFAHNLGASLFYPTPRLRRPRWANISARPGLAGTITMVLHRQDAGTTTVTTFSGGLTADHQVLKGSFETVRKSATRRHVNTGSWYMRAAGRHPSGWPFVYPGSVVTLSPRDFREAMRALGPRVQRCYRKYRLPGKAVVWVTIRRDGKPRRIRVRGLFGGSPTAACVEHIVSKVRFPKFGGKGKEPTLTFPFVLGK